MLSRQLLTGFTFILALLSAFCADAQKLLSKSRQSSYYTYIYKLEPQQALNIYKNQGKKLDDNILHHPIDSFKTDSGLKKILPYGNYINVKAYKNSLDYNLVEKHNVVIDIFSNAGDQQFTIVNTAGKAINPEVVKINGRVISVDAVSKSYHIKTGKKPSIIQVSYQGIDNFFTTGDQVRPLYRNYLISKPGFFKSLWLSITHLFQKDKNNNRRHRFGDDYTGFVVFNKPIYKPHDTVRFKAFIIDRKTKAPVSIKQLDVNINEDQRIAAVNSYRDGGFEYSFVLADSLKLTLDRNYEVSLLLTREDAKKRGIDEDEESERKVIGENFRYEAYELKSTKFTMRVAHQDHSPGTPQTVYLKATDENDLPIADGRVDLTFIHNGYINSDYPANHLFIPDTLWKRQVKLDPLGETKVPVPDSIFLNSNVTYSVQANFLNSANERRTANSYATFSPENFIIDAAVKDDTLKIDYKDRGKSINHSAVITEVHTEPRGSDTLSKRSITLPAKILINPYVTVYKISADSASKQVLMNNYQYLPNIIVDATRTADSVYALVKNPTGLKFWYSVFAGKHLISQGEVNQLDYRHAYNGTDQVNVIVNYFWGGTNRSKSAMAVYRKDLLNVVVKQPVTAYPGQQLKTDILVTNVDGKPVPSVDVTAWGITSKFPDYYPTQALYLGDPAAGYKAAPYWNLGIIPAAGSMDLKWIRWSKEMGLDSIAYYQFTHTKGIYRSEETAPGDITQIAPFIVKNGKVLPVYILYIDERPVYFNQAQQINNYSFETTGGLHSLRFRTDSQSIRVDSVYVPPLKKLIIGINADKGKSIRITDTLTQYEARQINAYLISLINNFGTKQVAISKGNRIYSIKPVTYPGQSALVGPLSGNFAFLELKGQPPVSFTSEGGYSYFFSTGYLKQKSVADFPFNRQLKATFTTDDYNQYFLTQPMVDTIWQDYFDNRARTNRLFQAASYTGQLGHLTIAFDVKRGEQPPFIKSVIFYRDDNPDFTDIYPGNTTNFYQLEKGKYRVLFLLKGDAYDLKEIEIKPFGNNYYRFKISATHPRDGVSSKISETINNRPLDYYNSSSTRDETIIKEAFNEKYLDVTNFSKMMTGTVYDQDGKTTVIGASVIVKGTGHGMVTDIDGHFRMAVPLRGKLVISSIGYEPQEINITPGANIIIKLKDNVKSLREVSIVGYGTQMKRSVTYMADTVEYHAADYAVGLTGKVAGLSIQPAPNGTTRFVLRGNSNIGGNTALIVLNGVPISQEDITKINPDDIVSTDVLNGASATALYGAQAANGVVIITTKPGAGKKGAGPEAAVDQAGQGGLRHNFSDYVFWQPKLTTDAAGRASFTTTIPDDITNWRTFFLGINDQKQSGFKELSIKSFRPVSASVLAPQFAVRGDELNIIGKVMNYTDTSVQVTRTFKYNGTQLKEDVLSVKNAAIDTLKVEAAGKDSLNFEYTIKRGNNGYMDGERRSIPIVEKGVIETKGVFEALRKDTSLNLQFDQKSGPVTFRAEASALPVLLETTEHLRDYKYLCNEQLASKLKGLLSEKRIKDYLKEPFKWDKNVKDIITKLLSSRKSQGTWGWWTDSEEELWISLHAVEALTEAKKMGYAVNLDQQKLIDYLVFQLESYNGHDQLDCLEILHLLNATVNYAKYTDSVRKNLIRRKDFTTYNSLRLMLIKSETGQKINTDSLLALQQHTMFGNTYWGKNSYDFFDNSIQNTVLAYKIFSADNKQADLLERIRGYFLEQRKDGDWRNTYETSLVLETILPDILKENVQINPAKLTVNGTTVTRFPYSSTLTGNTASLSKTGTMPVYVTGYQQFFNRNPEKVSKDFTVGTWFEKNNQHITRLTGGEVVQLKVKVTVRADADYVMTEVPIPAGCSYESKEQAWGNNEVHREYFYEKVSIFCRKLKQGDYTFTINLMPRYDGVYTLNPAKAEMMYFPVFYGREAMKQVAIGGK